MISSDISKDSLIEKYNIGLPEILCRTFGVVDFILVPAPAAKIIIDLLFIAVLDS
ncbi:MAG: Uncharacterised protein [Arcobacter lacus]|nr:MAG: Uncharacterised protein [Arcobacter lacus]